MKFCPLFSGSSGNSILVGDSETNILIDAGVTGKAIESQLKSLEVDPSNIDAIFITHEHLDHIKGAGILSRRYNIPIYANKLTWQAMEKSLGKIKEQNIKVIDSKFVTINNLEIENFKISHDAADPSGYIIHGDKKSACIATDLGYFSDTVKDHIKDCDVILLESNHDEEMVKFGPYPYPLKRRILSNIGHLSNQSCGESIVKILGDKQKTIYLGHLSKTNNYPELAYETVISVLRDNNIVPDKDVTIHMANRDRHSVLKNL